MKNIKNRMSLIVSILFITSICSISPNANQFVSGNKAYAAILPINKTTSNSVKVTTISLDKTTDTLTVGSKDTLTATVAPNNATNKAVTWITSNAKVATVTNGKVTAVSTGTAKVTATTIDGNKIASCTVTVNPVVKVTTVSLNKTTDTLTVGSKDTLTVAVAPNNATNKAVTWITSNAKVATVTNGKVTAVSAGTAKVTATTIDGNKTASCTVTVNPVVKVTTVSLNKTTDTLTVGSKDTLTAAVAPNNATNKTVTWTTSNAKVATVTNGKVTAVSTGTAKVTAATIDGNKTASCTVTVNPVVKVTTVSLNKTTDTLTVGSKDTLTVAVAPNNATNKTVTWTTSNAKVATVTNGKVTAVSTGTAKVTATTIDGNKTASCTVTVNPVVKVTTVSLNKTTDILTVGSKDTLTVAVAPNNATNKTVTWTTSNAKVATVDNTGKVTAVSAGTAKVTATTVDGSKTAICTMTVNNVVNSNTGLSLNVTNIPKEANKLIVVIDQGGINTRVEIPYDGSGSVKDALSIPAGNAYRIRIIAIKNGEVFPTILGGRTESNITVVKGEQKNVSIALSAPKVTLDASTPSQVNASSKFTIKMNISDPADFLGSDGRIWWDTTYNGVNNLYGAQSSGSITKISDGKYQFSIELTAPATPCKFYYQFGGSNFSFESPQGDEAPFLVLPNYEKGEQPYVINVVNSNTGLSLNVTNIPKEANKLIVVIDQGGINTRVEIPYDGSGSVKDALSIPAGNAYRIRIIAIKNGEVFPTILGGRTESNITVVKGEQKNVSIALSAPKVTLDASTPSQVNASSKFTIKMNISDPADFLGSDGRIWWDTTYNGVNNLYGAQSSGSITKISDGKYEFSIELTAPATPCKFYYQFGGSNFSFESPQGDEAPFLVLPNYEKGEQPYVINVVNSNTGLSLNVTNIPKEANKLIAVIDQGGINTRVEIPYDGSGSVKDALSIPAGNPYRIRIIAIKNGEVFPAILGGGTESNITVVKGEQKNVSIALSAPKVTLDASTPSQVNASSKFTIKMNISDPADFLGSDGRIWWDTTYNGVNNLYGAQSLGSITKISDGKYQFSIELTAPATPCEFYYQFGGSNFSFESPQGDEAPFLVLPNYEKGEQPYVINVVNSNT